MLKRLVATLISSVVFGLIITIWDPFRLFGYFSWIGVWFFTIYSFPVYLLGGIPLSLFIEKILRKKSFKSKRILYLMNLMLYGVAGLVTGFIYMMVFAIAESELYLISSALASYLFYGLVAALIFFHVLFFMKKSGLSKYIDTKYTVR